MGAAAGAGIVARNLHNPHRPGKRPLCPVGKGRQFFRAGGEDTHRDIPHHRPVGLGLDFRQRFRRNHAVKIDDHALQVHMKARIVVAPALVDNAGNNVLSAVLLHPHKPVLIIDGTLHLGAGRQRSVTQVDNILPLLPGIQHPGIPQNTGIRCLAAAKGVKRRSIQHHFKALFRLGAGDNLCLEGSQVAVEIIEFFGHNGGSFL